MTSDTNPDPTPGVQERATATNDVALQGDHPRRPRRALSTLWLAGSVVLIALTGVKWASIPAVERFRPPTSPLDNVAGLNETTRLGWAFLWQAREVLPAGSTYTIVASDAQIEMTTYMMSLAVLTECHGLPTSYYLKPSAESGATARYVLVYGCSVQPEGATMVQKLDDGCVWERSAK